MFFVPGFAEALSLGEIKRVNLPWLSDPLFDLAGHHIALLGIAAFVGLMALGLIVARILQSGFVRRLLSRLKLDKNLVAILTTVLGVAALVFFTVSAINGLGIPLAWSAPLDFIAHEAISV